MTDQVKRKGIDHAEKFLTKIEARTVNQKGEAARSLNDPCTSQNSHQKMRIRQKGIKISKTEELQQD